MKIIVVLVALTHTVKGLPQYDYPRPSPANSFNYDRPNNGGSNGGNEGSNGGNGGSNGGNKGNNGGIYGGSNGGNGGSYGRNGVSNGGNGGSYGGNGQSSVDQFNYNGEDDNNDKSVHKHIYVHVPPPELNGRPQTGRPARPSRPEKHYKIVFIKAPTPAPAVSNIPAPPLVEEKTLVYVLVKKPEDIDDLTTPAPEPTEPSKPEVYFIRYKSKKEDAGETENGYERKLKVSDVEEKEYKRPGYLPSLTQLFSSPILQYNSEYSY